MTPMLDTLKVAKGLRDHFSQEQAEALATVFSAAATERFATKEDIAELRTELKADIAELRTELKAEIAELKMELKADFAQLKIDVAKWIFTAIGFNFLATAGLFLGFFKLFVK